MPAILNYAIHLVLASILFGLFFRAYVFITPYNEVLLIRQGNNAAMLSLGGALLGFALTIGSAIVHTAYYREFLAWAGGAMLVQVLAHFIAAKLLHMSKDQIESGNAAFGGLMGAISLSIGIINAACIS